MKLRKTDKMQLELLPIKFRQKLGMKSKFNQTKVNSKIINGSLTPVYKGWKLLSAYKRWANN